MTGFYSTENIQSVPKDLFYIIQFRIWSTDLMSVCVCVCVCVSHSVVSLFATPWTIAHQDLCHGNSPHKNTGVGCHSCLQGIFPTQGLNLGLLHCRQVLYHLSHQGNPRVGESISCLVVSGLLCPTLCDPMDYSPLGSSVHGIFQVRILEWVAIFSSMRPSPHRDWKWVSCIAGELFTKPPRVWGGKQCKVLQF